MAERWNTTWSCVLLVPVLTSASIAACSDSKVAGGSLGDRGGASQGGEIENAGGEGPKEGGVLSGGGIAIAGSADGGTANAGEAAVGAAESGGEAADAGAGGEGGRAGAPDCEMPKPVESDNHGCVVPTPPGITPPPTCDNPRGSEVCTPADPPCGVTAPCNGDSPCLAMGSNASKATAALRFRELLVTAPAPLASAGVEALVDQVIQLPSACGEGGYGGRNWIVLLDKAAGKLTLGGAPPSTDPFGAGYCYVDMAVGGLDVKSVTVDAKQLSEGRWQSAPIAHISLPTFAGGDVTKASILPLQHVQLTFDLSSGDDCVGRYNGDAGGVLSANASSVCATSTTCARWRTAGSFSGYITLDDADTVVLTSTGHSLCMLLTGNASPAADGVHCARDADGKIVAQGNYCSSKNAPAGCGCADSFWLAATFAASAVNTNDGQSIPQCNGSTSIAN